MHFTKIKVLYLTHLYTEFKLLGMHEANQSFTEVIKSLLYTLQVSIIHYVQMT